MNRRNFLAALGIGAVGATSTGCAGAVAGFLIADHEAHVRGQYEVKAAKILAGTNQAKPKHDYDFFACEGIRDFDGNGVFVFPQEAMGIGEEFPTGRNITFVGQFHYTKGSEIGFEVQDSRGNRIDSTSFVVDRINHAQYFTYGKNLAPGNYSAVWKKGPSVVGKTDVKIR